jgi:hypothetical protein
MSDCMVAPCERWPVDTGARWQVESTWHGWHDTPRVICLHPRHCCRRRHRNPAFCGCMYARRATCMFDKVVVRKVYAVCLPKSRQPTARTYICVPDACQPSHKMHSMPIAVVPVVQVLMEAEEHIIVLISIKHARGHLGALLWCLQSTAACGIRPGEDCRSNVCRVSQRNSARGKFRARTAASSPSLTGGAAGRAMGASGLQSPYRNWLASSPSSSTRIGSKAHHQQCVPLIEAMDIEIRSI